MGNSYLVAAAYTFWASLLVSPWVARWPGSQYWFLFVVFSACVTAEYLGAIEEELRRYFSALIFVVIQLGLIILFRLPFLPLSVLTLLGLLIGLRFPLYFSINEFSSDFAWGLLALFASMLLQNRAGLEIGVGNIVMFVVIGVGLCVVFNHQRMTIGGQRNSRKLVPVVVVFSAMAMLGSLTVRFLAESSLKDFLLAALEQVYSLVVRVFLGLLYPVLMLLSPVYEWLKALLDGFEQRPPSEGGEFDPLQPYLPDGSLSEQSSLPSAAWWILGFTCLALLAFFVLRRVLPKPDSKEHTGYLEEKESLLTGNELKKDVGESLKHIRDLISQRTHRQFGKTPSERVRAIYFGFLEKNRSVHPIGADQTPREYASTLELQGEVGRAVIALTELYNLARYRGELTESDVRLAKQAWRRIKMGVNE